MNRGFVALISVIIISLVLVVLAVSLSFSSFFGRYNILDSEMKDTSVYLAEACVDKALIELASESTYSPTNEVVAVGTEECTIESVTTSLGNKVIGVEAEYKNYFTHLRVEVDADDLSVVSWQELSS